MNKHQGWSNYQLPILVAAITLFVHGVAYAGDKAPVLIGFDGAYSLKKSTSAPAIEFGIRVAIHEINDNGGILGGRPLKLITKDNRSVPARGIKNLKLFAAMPDLVAVFGGRFSTVQLPQVPTIHELKLPFLDVWGAADGITDHKYRPSYTFRLSLKDSWAMPVMVKHLQRLGITEVGALLPNTGWGRSNEMALSVTQGKTPNLKVVHTEWYNFGDKNMLTYYEKLLSKGAKGIVFVANDIEGAGLVRQLGKSASIRRVPISSHWGVTGGDMLESSGPTLTEMDYAVVQTFSFFNAAPSQVQAFLKSAKATTGTEKIEAIKSPVGVGHAYDMTHILAKAINQAGSTDREAIRAALESNIMHKGLVRDYNPAFTTKRHDALFPEQVFMAKFHPDGTIRPLKP